MTVDQISLAFRSRLLALDNETVVYLLSEYRKVIEDLQSELNALTAIISKRQAEGKVISESFLFSEARYLRYIAKLRQEMRDYAALVVDTVSDAQKIAVQLALDSAERVFSESYKNAPNNFDIAFMRFDEFAARNMVARLSDKTYLERLTDRFEPQAFSDFRQVFTFGIVQGLGIKDVTARLIEKLNFPYNKAQTIARTEINSAYRDGSLERFQQSQVVKAWRWSATLDERTCPVCIALHGKVFPLTTPFSTHPSCRCSPDAVTMTWEELGLGNLGLENLVDPRLFQTGKEWFDSRPESVQQKILGKGKYELYSSGRISLEDLVEEYRHPIYGPSRQERSIKTLKELRII